MSAGPAPVPVTVGTGFLGSGKTTLIRRLLASPALRDTAVIVNELGEIGLDHRILRQVDENVVVLPGGCLCCRLRDDLGAAMRDLLTRRASGAVPAFTRLVTEATGLADPVPILHTLLTEPGIDREFRLAHVVATVDAVNGGRHLARHEESAKQAAVADRIVITKTDLAAAPTVAGLARRLARLNPAAAIHAVPSPDVRAEDLLAGPDLEPEARTAGLGPWFAAGPAPAPGGDPHRRDERIAAHAIAFERPIDWSAFCVWLTMLLHARGADVLRVKGLLNVPGRPGPVVIDGVQHIVHSPIHLERRTDEDRRSRLVVIARDIDRAAIVDSLTAFLDAAASIGDRDRDRPGEVVPAGAGGRIGGRPFRRAGAPSWMG